MRRVADRFLAARYAVELEGRYHTNFRLDADGERLVLTRPDGTAADGWVLPRMPRDVGYGRPGDGGTGLAYFAEPSPGRANPLEGAIDFLDPPVFTVPAGFHAQAVVVGVVSPDPGTVLRARAYRAGALPSEVTTASYFIHPLGRDRYRVPVVSLATAPGNLLDPDRGIYVAGTSPGGNYAQTGDAWERPVHVEFFETNGERCRALDGDLFPGAPGPDRGGGA